MQVEFWSCINIFSYSVTLKSIVLSCTLSGYYTPASFCNIINWSFGKYWITDTEALSHIAKSYGIISKTIVFINTTHLTRKYFKYWKSIQRLVLDMFFKILVFLKSSNFIIDAKSTDFFPLEVTGSLQTFCVCVCVNTSANAQI